MKKWLWLIGLTLVLCVVWAGAAAPAIGQSADPDATDARIPPSLFIVSIDGIRNSEAFDAPNPAEFVPRIWGELKPQAAWYKNFYNLAETYTTPGNNTLVNGAWAFAPNIGKTMDLRAQAPTVFEYYRRAYPNVPRSKTWAVVGKANVRHADYSRHPFFGAAYGAALSFPAESQDAITWQEMQRVMDTYHPNLVFLHLGEVDHAGHTGDRDTYVAAIRQADSIVADLWAKLQADRYYRGRTTLIVTSDHGRHDDDHGGFKGHGGICEGDRRLPFLALGRGIQPGLEIDAPHSQVDIAPTVGRLLGFRTPLVDGHVLVEMLTPLPHPPLLTDDRISDDLRLTNDPGRSERPAIAANWLGLHVVWADDRSGARSETGQSAIYYKFRPTGSTAWTDDLLISESGIEARAPAVTADDNFVHVTWQGLARSETGQSSGSVGDRPEQWALFYRRYTPLSGWSPVTEIARSVVEGEPGGPAMLWEPEIVTASTGPVVGAPVYPGQVRAYPADNAWSASQVTGEGNNAHGVALAADGDRVYATWSQIGDGSWDIFYNHSTDGGQTWGGVRRLTSDVYNSYDPSIAAADGQVHLVWADDRSGTFQVYYRHSTDGGRTWTRDVPLTPATPDGGSWHPSLVVAGQRLTLAWEDYRDGNAEVYARESLDGGVTWSADRRVTAAAAYSIYPRLTADGTLTHGVWQDNRDGNWEIYFAEELNAAPTP
jgi:hypothetical protein